jgi:hypothetical protein
MGTSGAYGGSGAGAWDDAHTAYEQAAGPSKATPPIAKVAEALIAALRRGNGATATAPGSYDAGTVRPSRGSSGDHTRSSTGGGGRVAGGGMGRHTARGATAVGGAAAYRARDAAALADLGLDLAALEELPSDRARCTAIADALLGAPAHPDDAALKAAAIQTMMEALRSPDELSSDDLVESFTANLTYELVMVEITSQRRAASVRPKDAAKTETKMKKYIRNVLRTPRNQAERRLSTQGLVDRAVALASRVLNIFGRKP